MNSTDDAVYEWQPGLDLEKGPLPDTPPELEKACFARIKETDEAFTWIPDEKRWVRYVSSTCPKCGHEW